MDQGLLKLTMMKEGLKWLLASCALSTVLAGCVYSKQPVGDEVVSLNADEWNGVWLINRDEVATVTVRDADAGILEMALLEDCAKACKLGLYNIEVRRSGDLLFGNEYDVEKQSWQFARITKDAGQVVLWYPDQEKIAALIKSGQLPGKRDSYSIMLGELNSAQRDLFESEGIYRYQNPMVLQRWSDE